MPDEKPVRSMKEFLSKYLPNYDPPPDDIPEFWDWVAANLLRSLAADRRREGGCVSEVRGKCEFCEYVERRRNWAPCASCHRDMRRPEWRPSDVGKYALRLASDLTAAREDAERWRALEALDRGLGGWHLTVHEGHPPENCVIHYSRTGTYYTGATFAEAFDAMRAALDQQEVGDGE